MAKVVSKPEHRDPYDTVASTEAFDQNLDLLRHMARVHASISDEVSDDFVLAKLGDKEREYVTEMVSNGYYAKKLLDDLATQSTQWHWNKDLVQYELHPLSLHDCQTILAISERLFATFMNRVFMLVILNRNVAANPLVELLANASRKNDDEDTAQETADLKTKLGELLKPKETQP